MEVSKTELEGVLLIKPPTVSEDFRGVYVETYNEKMYHEAGIKVHFVQDDYSMSSRNVLRGIHGDAETWKLVSCPLGRLYFVVANCDESSKQYRKWTSLILSEENKLQVLVPPKFGNGHLVLSERAIFHYKQSSYYSRTGQFSIKWNDPRFGIWWPTKEPILSKRDSGEH
jgi:dTDP-4-dehydrorhamnose 3,5-epimerase